VFALAKEGVTRKLVLCKGNNKPGLVVAIAKEAKNKRSTCPLYCFAFLFSKGHAEGV